MDASQIQQQGFDSGLGGSAAASAESDILISQISSGSGGGGGGGGSNDESRAAINRILEQLKQLFVDQNKQIKLEQNIAQFTLNLRVKACTPLGKRNADRQDGLYCLIDVHCSNLDGSPPSVIIGCFCEKHAKEFLNLTFIQNVMFNQIYYLPIAYKGSKENVNIMFNLLSFNFKNGEAAIRKQLSGFPEPIENLDMIVKLFYRMSQVLGGENAETKNLIPLLIRFYSLYNEHTSELMNCIKYDTITMMFSSDWLEQNKQNHLVMRIMQSLSPSKVIKNGNEIDLKAITNAEELVDKTILIYNVPMLWLTLVDILIYLCFYPSIRVLERNVAECHTPTIQTFNGNLIYGVGYGTQFDCPDLFTRSSSSDTAVDNMPRDSAASVYLRKKPKTYACSFLIVDAVRHGVYLPPIFDYKTGNSCTLNAKMSKYLSNTTL
ncbi:LbFV_orf20-like [Cotesia congregata filamentous virus 1]|uniref:LbFV_orf20-like n=1 Tax=Cotesia congregata filamentous virus 1 TaxID=3064291 RepID=A0ABC8QJM3_9VIRU|nr:LbFV_orf20-like [Cotesia congregata filamentous virus 1]